MSLESFNIFIVSVLVGLGVLLSINTTLQFMFIKPGTDGALTRSIKYDLRFFVAIIIWIIICFCNPYIWN